MSIARRQVVKGFALSAGLVAAAQENSAGIQVLRDTATIHGTNLDDARLRIIRPALERHLSQLRALRALELEDSVGPTPGILVE